MSLFVSSLSQTTDVPGAQTSVMVYGLKSLLISLGQEHVDKSCNVVKCNRRIYKTPESPRYRPTCHLGAIWVFQSDLTKIECFLKVYAFELLIFRLFLLSNFFCIEFRITISDFLIMEFSASKAT